MKYGTAKKGLAFVLAVTMGIGLCACGKEGGSAGSKDEKRYFSAEYQENLPKTFSSNARNVVFHGDTMYYSAYNDDYTKEGLYSYNLLTGEEKTYWEQEEMMYSEEGEYSTELNKDISYFTVDADDNIYVYFSCSQVDEESLNADYSNATLDDVISYMVDSWGYGEDMAREDWEAYYADSYVDEDGNPDYSKFLKEVGINYIYTNVIEKMDADGNNVYTYDFAEEENLNVSCYGIAADKDGKLFACINEWDNEGISDIYYATVLDKSGKELGQISFDDYIAGILTLADGSVAYIGYGESGVEIYPLDGEKLSAGDGIPVGNSSTLIPLDDENLLMQDGSTLYKYNMKDGSKEEYLSWMDCNISSSSVMSFGVLSDGNLAVFLQNWNSTSDGNQSEVAIVKEIDAEQAKNIKNINVACLWLDYTVEEKAIEFNKKHDDYHISIREFNDADEEDAYEDMVNAFTTAIVSDPDIDIVIFNDYSQVLNFAAKGLLTDIYEKIDGDAELKREDFLPNILTACEYDGKLVTLPTSFTLNTVIGKSEDVGDEPGWTLDDMKALLASKPEGTQLFYGMTRDQMLSMCLSLGYDNYINWEDATCNFNSPEFVDVLEFANMFPEEFEYEEDVDSTVLMNTGKVLLDTYYLGDFENIQMYTEVFGGDLTYIGYPTNEGNGAMLSLNNMYGITTNCDDTDAAWEFIRQFYLPTEKGEDDDYNAGYYGFSVRQDDFDYYCEEAMKEDEYGGGTWGWGEFEIEIQPATQEQVDDVKELVNNTTAVNGAVSSDILNIINEEAAAYFSGQKAAEDVAATLQSRMEIYLSETK